MSGGEVFNATGLFACALCKRGRGPEGRRVQESLNGTVIEQWVWSSGSQPLEERNSSGSVTKRFYGSLGEQISGGSKLLFHNRPLGLGSRDGGFERDNSGTKAKVANLAPALVKELASPKAAFGFDYLQ